MKNRNWTSKAKKFASLAAAGAGAVSLTASKAEASIITSNTLNTVIGFSAGAIGEGTHTAASHLFNTFLGGPALLFKAKTFRSSSFFTRKVTAASNVAFLGYGGVLKPVSAGVITTASEPLTDNLVARRSWNSSGSTTTGVGSPFNDKYYLFHFDNGNGVRYGWLEASLSLSIVSNANPSAGPNLTVIRYAFDDTGNTIAAGQTQESAPEPASLAETGLGALILGAEGLRRWRKARKAA